ncbi:hypothetical protein VULLAG_LOCUS1037 [Vulpes lagopus]
MQLPWWTVRTWGVALRRQNLHPANPTSEQPATPLSQPGVCGHKWGRGTGRSQAGGWGGWGGGGVEMQKPVPAAFPLPPQPALKTLQPYFPAGHLFPPLEHFLYTDQHILGLSCSKPDPSAPLLHEHSPKPAHPAWLQPAGTRPPPPPPGALPSPRAGQARPVSTPKLASRGPARIEEDSGRDPELDLKAPYSWLQQVPW